MAEVGVMLMICSGTEVVFVTAPPHELNVMVPPPALDIADGVVQAPACASPIILFPITLPSTSAQKAAMESNVLLPTFFRKENTAATAISAASINIPHSDNVGIDPMGA